MTHTAAASRAMQGLPMTLVPAPKHGWIELTIEGERFTIVHRQLNGSLKIVDQA
jgi:hypothetical protein